jgi:hypothetical protein
MLTRPLGQLVNIKIMGISGDISPEAQDGVKTPSEQGELGGVNFAEQNLPP